MCISNFIPTKETSLFHPFFFFSPGNNLRLLPESLQLSSSSAWAALFARMCVQKWLCSWTQPQLEACFPLLLLEKVKPSCPRWNHFCQVVNCIFVLGLTKNFLNIVALNFNKKLKGKVLRWPFCCWRMEGLG